MHTLGDLSAYSTVDAFAKLDTLREIRTGFPEVIFGQGKSNLQILKIMNNAISTKRSMFATRIVPEVASYLQSHLNPTSSFEYYEDARIAAIGCSVEVGTEVHPITVMSAGSADLPMAEEAAMTLALNGVHPTRVYDCGVAGLGRLLEQVHVLRKSQVIICVAGMEGALPSVVAGLVDCPVIAVPTSVGYGANMQGVVPLLAMISSCAPGVAVVNIDNGFGAAAMALKIINLKLLK